MKLREINNRRLVSVTRGRKRLANEVIFRDDFSRKGGVEDEYLL